MRAWIGGGPCSGKSSIADIISARLDGLVYHADDDFVEHGARASQNSRIRQVTEASFAELFQRNVDVMLADYLAVSEEEFPMIVEDLPDASSAPLVVEGCALLPALMPAVLTSEDVFVVLAPSEAFQRRMYAARPGVAGMLEGSRDPNVVWESWRRRDAAFSALVREDAVRLGFPIIDVDGTDSIETVTERVWALVRGDGA